MNLHTQHLTKSNSTRTPDFRVEIEGLEPEHTVYTEEYGTILFRPIRVDDEKLMIKFHEGLSEESIHLRYFEQISLDTRILHERLSKVCTNTADSYAIVAEQSENRLHSPEIMAVGRLITIDLAGVAGFALLVSDVAHHTVISHDLLGRLIMIARAHGFHTLKGELLVADYDTLALCRHLGFITHTVLEDGFIQVSYPL